MGQGNYSALCAKLERQELDAPTGVASDKVYSQLLAIYLYQHDLCNAKFLWQRIPNEVKDTNKEISLIWKVGQCMWKRDHPGIYAALQEQWSDNVSSIMSALRDEVRKRAIELIGHAYSSITLTDLATMAGVSTEDAAKLTAEQGWPINTVTQIVEPSRPKPATLDTTTTEGQLHKLTEFVSFLEN